MSNYRGYLFVWSKLERNVRGIFGFSIRHIHARFREEIVDSKKKKKEQGGRGKIGLWKKKKERKAGMYAMPNYEDFIAG